MHSVSINDTPCLSLRYTLPQSTILSVSVYALLRLGLQTSVSTSRSPLRLRFVDCLLRDRQTFVRERAGPNTVFASSVKSCWSSPDDYLRARQATVFELASPPYSSSSGHRIRPHSIVVFEHARSGGYPRRVRTRSRLV
ncbi:hypothetical protein K523DRAFT_152197 [Schizophyllum commune Tattone D]|nr:hypothetical protein K523DRAFT_152197 [Schizophyllum commune Tattone D]